MSRRRLGIVGCAALLVSAACGGGSSGPVPGYVRGSAEFAQVALADAPDVGAVVAASDAFGLRVLAGRDPQETLVFSPASAFVALAMLGEGATNEGAAELDALLGSSGDARSRAVNALAGVLAPFDGDPAAVDDEDLPDRPLVHVANNVVLDDQAQAAPTYLDRLARYYDAGVQVADLAGADGKAVLDAWVRENTGGRVEESAIVPDATLFLVLQDAILFAARWQQEFDPTLTAPAPFTAASGAVQTGDFMRSLGALRYAEVDGWAAVELPYQEGFAARIVLPPVGVDPTSDAATVDALGQALAAAAPSSVQVAIPRFETDSTVELTEVLRAEGLSAIFEDSSRSFQGISADVELLVGQAVQQATITVGEQGTVAAAVTEIGVAGTSAPPPPEHRFVADRPFLFLVQEQATGWDLFQAVVRGVE